MITITLVFVSIMLLMWLGLSGLGIGFSEGLGWLLFLSAVVILFALYGFVSVCFRRR